ncbi:hypothetical protein BGX29_009784 [Mortierella sp. GBA35]|nr:hypothetical protein BGX29_009784 [Mortierella sp. GBA35]
MAGLQDRRDPAQSARIPEEEQTTFGQQSPYAAGYDSGPSSSTAFPAFPSIPSRAPPTSASESQHSKFISPQQSVAPSPVPLTVPIQHEPQHYPQDFDDQPPAYDDVARPGAPQNYYGNNNNSNNHGYSNPSAPLLPPSGPPATSYSAIPSAPATPYTRGSPRSIYGESDDGSHRFNKFWLIFLAVVVLLSITVDDDNKVDSGNCGAGFTRNLINQTVPISYNKIDITADGLLATVIVEQRNYEGDELAKAIFSIDATGRDRDDLGTVAHELHIDPSRGHMFGFVTRKPGADPSDCISVVIRVSIPPSMSLIDRLRITVNEGNATMDMLRPDMSLKIKELASRVVTGYTRIDANVDKLQLGGSFGKIEGSVVVGDSMTVLMVEGDVALDVSQSAQTIDGKINVTKGNIDIALTQQTTPYVGTFQLETGSGEVEVHNADARTTRLKYKSHKLIKGWVSLTGREPHGKMSSLKLSTHQGSADLDLARHTDP